MPHPETRFTTFEDVWEKIGGNNNTSLEEALSIIEEEIVSREHLIYQYISAKAFNKTLSIAEEERMAFVYAKYGLLDLSYLDRGRENEPPIWREAFAKRKELFKTTSNKA